MQLTLKELSDELSEHITIFWVKRLTIIYFYSNGFLNTSTLSVHVKIFDSSSDSSSQDLFGPFITGFNVYKYGNRIQKECAFQYLIKSILSFCMWIFNLLCFHLLDDLF